MSAQICEKGVNTWNNVSNCGMYTSHFLKKDYEDYNHFIIILEMKGMGYCVEMFPYSPASATAILFQFYKVFIARIIRKVDKIDFEKFLKSCMYVWHICFQLSKKVFYKKSTQHKQNVDEFIEFIWSWIYKILIKVPF